jgi:hypothetical protein
LDVSSGSQDTDHMAWQNRRCCLLLLLLAVVFPCQTSRTPLSHPLAPPADPYAKFLLIKRDPPRSFREVLADLSSKGLAGLSRRSAGGSKLGAAGAAPGTLPAGASSRIIEASSAPAGYSLAKHSGGSGGALPGTPEDAQLEGAESGKLPGAAGTAVEGTPAV